MISIKCFKSEELGHSDGSITREDVKTAGWSVQIKSWRDIFQIDDDDDYPSKNELTDKVRESLR